MYRVIIVDDEYWIRNMLKNIIDWPQIGVEIIGEAEEGAEAIQLVKKLNPHIVITDIKMPCIDGIGFIQQIKKYNSNIKIIVLSGYDDFDYVRESMRLGAVDYLLKPIKKIELINVLIKVIESIEVDIQKQKDAFNTKSKLIQLANTIIGNTLSHIINDQVVYNPGILKQLKEFGFEWNYENYIVSIVKFVNVKEIIFKLFENNIELFMYAVKNIIDDVFKKKQHVSFFNANYLSELIIIFDYDVSHRVAGLFGRLVSAFQQYLNSYTKVGISDVVIKFEHIRKGYNQAKKCLNNQTFNIESEITAYSKNIGGVLYSKIDFKIQKLITYYVSISNHKEIYNLYNSVILKSKNISFGEVESRTFEFISLMQNQISKIGINLEEKYYEQLNDAINSYNIQKLSLLIEHIIKQTCNFIKSNKENKCIKSTIKEVKKYIDENYFSDLSLCSISKIFGVESTYLSKLFKQNIGKTITNYINNIRIEKAIEIIKNRKDIRISEISSMVGYSDYSYFSRVFKKYTGECPKELFKDISE